MNRTTKDCGRFIRKITLVAIKGSLKKAVQPKVLSIEINLIGTGRSPMLQSVSPASPFLPLPVAAPEEVGFDASRLARIGSVLNRDIADGQIPGAVVGIVRKDRLVALDSYGYRDVRGLSIH